MRFCKARGTVLRNGLQCVDGVFSNFKYCEEFYRSNSALARILSLLRVQNYSSILEEEIVESDCSILQEENIALATRRRDYRKSKVIRLSFFGGKNRTIPKRENFLGYAIYKEDHFGKTEIKEHIYEAVIRPHRYPRDGHYIHTSSKFSVVNSIGEFEVEGVLFGQQNGMTIVCAHVAIRTALSCIIPDENLSYKDFNKHAGIDHKKVKLIPCCRGLLPEEINKIISQYTKNAHPIKHEPEEKLFRKLSYQKYLYSFLESGSPVLMGFILSALNGNSSNLSERHLVPVLGHTFNEDAWFPSAESLYFKKNTEYIPSEKWLGTYIIHDENIGPYSRISRDYLGQDQVRLIIGFKPNKSVIDSIEAEGLSLMGARLMCRSIRSLKPDWYRRFRAYSECNMLVLRTLIIDRISYREHLNNLGSKDDEGMDPSDIELIVESLPENFWCTEVSAPELFPYTKGKFGEILVDANKELVKNIEDEDLHGHILGMRLPGFLVLKTTNGWMAKVNAISGFTKLFTYS